MFDVVTTNPAETRALGERLSRYLMPGDVVLLHGDLGAGKTTLTQGIARGLGIGGEIQSPTFTLVNEHAGRLPSGEAVILYHVDLYRLGDENDLDSIGFDDYAMPAAGITVLEWPERAGDRLPTDYLLIQLTPAAADRRQLSFAAVPDAGDLARRLAGFRQSLDLATSGVRDE